MFQFDSEEELAQWKKEIIEKAVNKEHVTKMGLIDEIILFCVYYPEHSHTLLSFTQCGGDTLEEYFDRVGNKEWYNSLRKPPFYKN